MESHTFSPQPPLLPEVSWEQEALSSQVLIPKTWWWKLLTPCNQGLSPVNHSHCHTAPSCLTHANFLPTPRTTLLLYILNENHLLLIHPIKHLLAGSIFAGFQQYSPRPHQFHKWQCPVIGNELPWPWLFQVLFCPLKSSVLRKTSSWIIVQTSSNSLIS